MRAVVHDRYGPPEVLRLEEVARPLSEDDEILVRVHATTVTRTDCGFRRPKPFFVRAFSGLLRPKHRILGSQLAGEVEAAGAAVSEFAVGDQVFGVNADRFGAHAAFVCMRENAPLAHTLQGPGRRPPLAEPLRDALSACRMTTRPRREPCPGVGYRAGGQEPRPPTGAPPRADSCSLALRP
jgi:Alcohol dehydrogenase GroES-like domain